MPGRARPGTFDASRLTPYLLMLGVCLLAAANVWLGPGMLQTHAGGDSPFLLQRTYEMVANLRAGVFPVRWMPDAAFGLGYPFFNFYAALPYYLAALLNLAGFDLLTAIKLTQTLGMCGAAVSMWLFARTMLPRPGALLAAVAYTLAPYHLVNLYVRGDSLQEFFAFVWFPLILWAVDRTVSRIDVMKGAGHDTRPFTWWARPRWAVRLPPILWLSLSLAALVLTHNVSALIFAPFIALYALLRLAQQALKWRRWSAPLHAALWLGGAALLAVALTAWFWLPALGEASGVQLGDQTTGYFNFDNHFRASNLVQPGLAFDYRVDQNLGVFAVALPQAVLAVLGGMVWLWRGPRRSAVWVILLFSLLSTLMVTPLSRPIWDVLPLLPLAQFPWRFLSVQALFGALLIGGLGQGGKGASLPLRIPAFLHPCALVLACAGLLLSLPGLPNERLDVRAEDVTPQSLQLYEWFSGNIGTTIRAEYLPATAQPRPVVGPDLLQQARRALSIDGVIASSRLEQQGPVMQRWRIRIDSAVATFTLPLLYWPAWHAATLSVAGVPSRDLPLSPYAGSGWVMLSLPRGEHVVQLWLAGTSLQHTGERLSLLALILTLAVAAAVLRRKALHLMGWGALSIAAIVVLAQVSRLFGAPSLPALQTVDYGDRQFPHRGPIIFHDQQGQSYELMGASLFPTRVGAGQPFTLTTTWRDDLAPVSVGLEQELPTGGYFASLFRFARSISYGPPQLSTHTAITDALPGPLLLAVIARDASGGLLTPTTPAGQVLGRTLLSGLIISEPASSAVRVSEGPFIRTFPNGIVLHRVDWYHPTNHDICFRSTWSSTRPLAAALQVSFLLRGADGREIARADTQPQAGLAPTWSWLPGVPVHDSDCVPIITRLQPGEAYTLLVRWYRVLDQQPTGEVTLVDEGANVTDNAPNVPHPAITAHLYTAPPIQYRTAVTFALPTRLTAEAGAIQLLGYDVITRDEALRVTLYWSASMTVTQDYKSFVHFAPVANPEPVRQVDRFTRDGMYPTGMWWPGEIVSDTVALDVRGVITGNYALSVGWYDPDTFARLPAIDHGIPMRDGRFVMAEVRR